MFAVFPGLGDVHVSAADDGVVEPVMDLPPEGIPDGQRQTVRVAATGEIEVEPRHPVLDR
jgi:hypothetical protein